MNKRITSLMFAAALMAAGTGCWADDVNATGNNNNPVEHPINAYNNHEVKSDMKDSQENSQKAAEAKATYKQAKADYEKSLKESGADSQVTKDAKSRMDDARKDLQKYNKKTAHANQEMKKDEMKAQQ
jgi:hypothetical protein